MPGETPTNAANSIGHYLNSRSATSDTLTSNLTFTKISTKSSAFNTLSESSDDQRKEVKSSYTPVAKPRSVYKDTIKEKSKSPPPISYPLTKTDAVDNSSSYQPNGQIVTVGNGGEDWGTKKRVETKTVKTIGK